MEPSTNQIEKIFQALGKKLSPENSKSLENTIIQWRKNYVNYPLNLLELISKSGNEVQLRASIELKLWSKQYSEQQDFENNKYESIIQDVKNMSLQLYLTIDNLCFKQLKEAIAYLCRKQYHQQWQDLPKQLIEVAGQNFEYLIRVLTLFKKITKRYSIQMRTDPLYTEIIFSCDEMHDFLLTTCTSLINNLNNILDQKSLIALKEGLKLFYNLNYQDLHPKFEDNLAPWMKILIDAIKMNGDSSNVELFKSKGAALKSIILYSNKYKEDIYDDTIQQFSIQVWNLFSNTSSSNPNLQNLMLQGLKFFRFLVSWSSSKRLYANSINDLTTTLVLPNIGINQDVKDEFDEETDLFLQYYFQAGDISSKRSYAIDLMKTILKVYPDEFKTFIYSFLESEAGKQLTVIEECQLYNLVIEVASSAYRPTEGCTQLSIDESTIKNCYISILKPRFQLIYQWIIDNPQKQIQQNFEPIQIAMQLRFIYFFRIFIPQQDLSLLLKYCSNLLSNHRTLRNIIYITTQAFLTIRHGDFTLQSNLIYYFSPNNVDDLALDILKMLYFNEKKEEKLNTRLCSLFHSLTSIIKQICVKYHEHILNILVSLLQKADTYQFKTILQVFEGFGNFIYWMVDRNQDLTQIESILHSYLTKLMESGSDLVNFILQIYAIVLLSKTNVPQIYHSIYTSLIDVKNWHQNNYSLFGSYAFYISSYFKRHPQKIVENKTQVQQIISVLIELKKPNIFFILMNQIYSKFDLQTFYETGYLKVLMIGIQTMVLNIQQMKTSIFKESLLFLSKIINNNNPQVVIKIMNESIPGFLENIIVESINIVSTISWREERKPIIVAVSSLLISSCFTNPAQTQCVINALIHNTIRRNRFGTLITKNQIPSETSFQKLSVFKLIKNNNSPPEAAKIQNEEEHLVNCIQHLINQHGIQGIGALLTEENQKQLTVLIRKYQEEGQAVV